MMNGSDLLNNVIRCLLSLGLVGRQRSWDIIYSVWTRSYNLFFNRGLNHPAHGFLVVSDFDFGIARCARLIAFTSFVVRLPMSQPQPLSNLTTFGVTAAARGTRTKMKDLWMANASANCVARPILLIKLLDVAK